MRQKQFTGYMKPNFFISTFPFSKLAGFLVANLFFVAVVVADSSSPRLAAYYDTFLAICGNKVYEWSDFDSPQEKMTGVTQVGVGKINRYALTQEEDLVYWSKDSPEIVTLMDESFPVRLSGGSPLQPRHVPILM